MKDYRHIIFYAMQVCILALASIALVQRHTIGRLRDELSIVPDTVRDTTYIEARIDSFKVAEELGIRKDTVTLPVIRYVAIQDIQDYAEGEQYEDEPYDSAIVEVPITQKCFVSDSSRIYVSGFRQNVDSAFFFYPHVTEYIPVEIVKRQKSRFALSVGVSGVVDRNGKMNTGIGITLGYVLWQK